MNPSQIKYLNATRDGVFSSRLYTNVLLLLTCEIRAANYIWMLSTPLPGLTREAHNEIACSLRGDAQPLSERSLTLCSEFSSELAETGRIRPRLLDTEEEEDLLLLYQNT